MAGVPGQGRKFDVDAALDNAMTVFWRHGYEGSSVATLTAAMGITAPSLYSAFGSKEALFRSAVEHYNDGFGGWMAAAFERQTSVPKLIETLLHDAAAHYTDASTPGGCLVISAATCVGEANNAVAEHLRELRNANIDRLTQHIEASRRDGHLPLSADARALADMVGATIQGMSQRARDGATGDELGAVARSMTAMITTLLSAPGVKM